MSQLRCAVYARFSSDRQSPTSIADQIRKCREHAARQGWLVLEEHVYPDEAISGASTERAGLQRLLAAATSPSRPFDCILTDDTSRLSRKLADALNLYERLSFAGIRVVAVSQGVDSEGPQAELLFGVHGLIDAVYWRELGQKTHRGMQGRALQGLATGGRVFGYRTIRGEDGSAQLVVKGKEAEIIRLIFSLYLKGNSLKWISHKLNADGVISPRPQGGRVSRSWCPASLLHILKNRRYTGKLIWNTTKKIRVPGTNRRIQRPRPESEWVVVDAPDLRIVSDQVFEAVERRFETVRHLWGRTNGRPGLTSGQQRQIYLFSGLLKCGLCRGSIILVSGRGRCGHDKYGCALHHHRGVCSNSLTIRRERLERLLLKGLQEAVLREEAVNHAVAPMKEELEQRFAALDAELEKLRERKRKLEAEVGSLVQAIADGQPSQSIIAAIGERERELGEISDRLLEPRPGFLHGSLEELRTFAVSRLKNLRTLLSHPESVNEARALLAQQFGKITLWPKSDSGDWHYEAKGAVDFFGE